MEINQINYDKFKNICNVFAPSAQEPTIKLKNRQQFMKHLLDVLERVDLSTDSQIQIFNDFLENIVNYYIPLEDIYDFYIDNNMSLRNFNVFLTSETGEYRKNFFSMFNRIEKALVGKDEESITSIIDLTDRGGMFVTNKIQNNRFLIAPKIHFNYIKQTPGFFINGLQALIEFENKWSGELGLNSITQQLIDENKVFSDTTIIGSSQLDSLFFEIFNNPRLLYWDKSLKNNSKTNISLIKIINSIIFPEKINVKKIENEYSKKAVKDILTNTTIVNLNDVKFSSKEIEYIINNNLKYENRKSLRYRLTMEIYKKYAENANSYIETNNNDIDNFDIDEYISKIKLPKLKDMVVEDFEYYLFVNYIINKNSYTFTEDTEIFVKQLLFLQIFLNKIYDVFSSDIRFEV